MIGDSADVVPGALPHTRGAGEERFPRGEGGKVAIQYTAGADGSSRLAGHVNWVGLTLFALSLGAMGMFGFRLWREAAEATGDQKPRRKK